MVLSLTGIFIVSWLNMACTDQPESGSPQAVAVHGESFKFFGVGVNSVLSADLSGDLSDLLGDSSTARKNVIDLETGYRGFLKEFFPELDQLNQGLNYPPRERIEHKTIKRMYRYARKKDVPFDYIEFLFSEYTKRPVLIRILFKEDVLNIAETLKQKYGPVKNVDVAIDGANVFSWRKNGDYLILSQVPDRAGNPRYQIVIYFVKRLEALKAAQEAQRDKIFQKKAEAGKTVF